jgi:hypothetical protein
MRGWCGERETKQQTERLGVFYRPRSTWGRALAISPTRTPRCFGLPVSAWRARRVGHGTGLSRAEAPQRWAGRAQARVTLKLEPLPAKQPLRDTSGAASWPSCTLPCSHVLMRSRCPEQDKEHDDPLLALVQAGDRGAGPVALFRRVSTRWRKICTTERPAVSQLDRKSF